MPQSHMNTSAKQIATSDTAKGLLKTIWMPFRPIADSEMPRAYSYLFVETIESYAYCLNRATFGIIPVIGNGGVINRRGLGAGSLAPAAIPHRACPNTGESACQKTTGKSRERSRGKYGRPSGNTFLRGFSPPLDRCAIFLHISLPQVSSGFKFYSEKAC